MAIMCMYTQSDSSSRRPKASLWWIRRELEVGQTHGVVDFPHLEIDGSQAARISPNGALLTCSRRLGQ